MLEEAVQYVKFILISFFLGGGMFNLDIKSFL